ncbi:unnamed protein product, partial [Closterium sp. Naga37s-1]
GTGKGVILSMASKALLVALLAARRRVSGCWLDSVVGEAVSVAAAGRVGLEEMSGTPDAGASVVAASVAAGMVAPAVGPQVPMGHYGEHGSIAPVGICVRPDARMLEGDVCVLPTTAASVYALTPRHVLEAVQRDEAAHSLLPQSHPAGSASTAAAIA